MHIPDGYLSPQTYVPLYAVFIGAAAIAVKKIKTETENKLIPYMGMAASFSFLIMMFNIPVPGGSTGHIVGAAICSLLFGPWVTFIAISVALIIQALVFGDGGITAIGANCVNMALAMPFVAWYSFKIVNSLKKNSDKLLNVAAFVAGYVSINITALLTAVEFGIQPLIARGTDGNPLYAPYPLKIAVPAMMIEHLLLFGLLEGIVTYLIFNYFYKHNKDIIAIIKVKNNETV